jgi:hypothetical protein
MREKFWKGMRQVVVSMGIAAVPLQKQLEDQDMRLRSSGLTAAHLDKYMSYIRQLWVHGFLDDRDRKSAELRLLKYIQDHIESVNQRFDP